MREEKMNPNQFVHECYSTENLRKIYAYTLKLINGPNLWVLLEDEPIIAPFSKRRGEVIPNLRGH